MKDNVSFSIAFLDSEVDYAGNKIQSERSCSVEVKHFFVWITSFEIFFCMLEKSKK